MMRRASLTSVSVISTMAYFENPVPENMPILEDLYNALLKHKNKKAERIANSLVLYVHGSQNYFNHRTNVDSPHHVL